MKTTHTRTSVVAAALIALAGYSLAGPLIPPSGNLASSFKTLGDVEPRIAINTINTPGDANSVYRITRPGSYYLTETLSGVSGKSAIVIAAPDVTIDLNGFSLIGIPGATFGIYGTSSNRTHISNGTVRNWGAAGIFLYGNDGSRLERVTVEANGTGGALLGSNCIVDSCIARGNGQTGIFVDATSIIRDSISDGNASGFSLSNGSRALGCSATSNSVDGFSVFDGVTIQDCIAYNNTQNGFSFGTHCLLENNVADANIAAGFYGRINSIRTLIKHNNATRNGQGIKLDAASNLVIGNTCTLNTTHFVIVAGNRVSNIVTLASSPAINGSTGGTPVSDPDANFAY